MGNSLRQHRAGAGLGGYGTAPPLIRASAPRESFAFIIGQNGQPDRAATVTHLLHSAHPDKNHLEASCVSVLGTALTHPLRGQRIHQALVIAEAFLDCADGTCSRIKSAHPKLLPDRQRDVALQWAVYSFLSAAYNRLGSTKIDRTTATLGRDLWFSLKAMAYNEDFFGSHDWQENRRAVCEAAANGGFSRFAHPDNGIKLLQEMPHADGFSRTALALLSAHPQRENALEECFGPATDQRVLLLLRANAAISRSRVHHD